MKRLLLTLTMLFALSAPALAVSGSAGAANVFQPCGGDAANTSVCQDVKSQGANTGKNNPIVKVIKTAINILSFIIGIGAVIGIVVSGIRIMTAGGSSEGVASARSGLIYSLVGLAVAILAQTIVLFVLDNIK